jgi:hypothetical protein
MSEFRVIYHQQTCPDCKSDNITEQEIQTTDGLTETALICGDCGAAWPVACIAEHLEPASPSPDQQAVVRAHLVLRIDGRSPAIGAARRWYWCPSCDAFLTGTELAAIPIVHYTPGPARIITADDLRPATAPEVTS